jgi:hypothetical protein
MTQGPPVVIQPLVEAVLRSDRVQTSCEQCQHVMHMQSVLAIVLLGGGADQVV